MKEFVRVLTSWGPFGVFGLALLDSAGVPLPAAVDALLVATAVVNPRAAYLAALMAVAGSTIGSLILYYIARRGGQAYLSQVEQSTYATNIRERFQTYGLITVFIPALLPIPLPLKVFVVCAGVFGVGPGAYLGTILAARIPRYFGLAWLGTQLGHDTMGWLKHHAWDIGLLAAALAAVLALLARARANRSLETSAGR